MDRQKHTHDHGHGLYFHYTLRTETNFLFSEASVNIPYNHTLWLEDVEHVLAPLLWYVRWEDVQGVTEKTPNLSGLR